MFTSVSLMPVKWVLFAFSIDHFFYNTNLDILQRIPVQSEEKRLQNKPQLQFLTSL